MPDSSKASYDVAVIGGGPAGSTVATLLQRQGHRCLVLESTSFPRYHIGESLIPHTYGTFDRLGLLSKMRESQFPVKHSVRFVSPSGKEAAPFYFHETIEGERAKTWQVKRSEFDVICQDNAREAGVEIRSATKVSKVHFEGTQAVGLRAETFGCEPEDIRAKVIVDASGRATVLGKQLDLKTDIPGLNKSAIWTYYRGAYRREGIDAGETTVFMIPERGWFWYIPLPDDIVSVGIVASSEYLFRTSNHYEDVFPVEVNLCQPLSEWLAGAEAVNPLRGIRKLAYINKQVVGDGWVMIGDAAGFLDPVYSSGLFLALVSGDLASNCIHEALESNDLRAEKLGGFVPRLWEGVEVIHRLVRAFYDPAFSFPEFAKRFPEQRSALIDCLIGDVVGRDMSGFLASLAQMTPPPIPLHTSVQ
jgi:flavin-dependent dehydrogenase